MLAAPASPKSPGAAPRSAAHDERAAPEPADLPPSAPSCKDVGPLQCDVPPSSPAELCARSAACFLKKLPDPNAIIPDHDFRCDALRDTVPAPANAGLRTTAVVHLDAAMDPEEVGSSWRVEATYLVAETPHVLCVADILIDWDVIKDYILEDEFQFTWSAENVPAPQLSVLTQQLNYNDAGFLQGEYCYRNEYAVAHAHFALKGKRADLEHRCFPSALGDEVP